ncbi:hypothetical protein NAPIS_ORF02063 [Vairimorpha apis BRL 01]|uniref:Septin-type G domain-containing protein n=1 Tax=Vairimorpha apis BRL 01 TaxID=1037528 RepID=T0MAF8_9MICR|nr:hypothetical protein NAPIS_ORF02063 [Vairimorpha apis BRL 01]
MYTKEELQLRKKQISDLLKTNNITFFIPETESSQDSEEDSSEDEFPLAVIASETMHEREGEIVRGRSYPWGFINIENENGNDFKKLQRMLIYKHYDELINKTHFVFYNEYRKNVIENEKMSESLQLTRYNKLMRDIHNKIKDKMRCKISELEDEEREIDMCIGRKEDKMKGD